MITAAVRVARGAALLDSKAPGWEARVDLGILDIGRPDVCLLGQLYGVYGLGKQELFGQYRSDSVCIPEGSSGVMGRYDQAYTYGFTGPDEAAVTAAWRDFIAARRLAIKRVLTHA